MDEDDHKKHRKIVDKIFREKYASGEKLALLQCVRWCDRYGLSLPRWALEASSIASAKYLKGTSENLHDAIFGAKKPMGSKANLATNFRTSLRDQLLFDVVTGLKNEEFQGGQLYELALERINKFELDFDCGFNGSSQHFSF